MVEERRVGKESVVACGASLEERWRSGGTRLRRKLCYEVCTGQVFEGGEVSWGRGIEAAG